MPIPPVVFVDTCAFESQNYQFDHEALTRFSDVCKSGGIDLVIPDVTCREVRRRIQKHAVTAIEAINATKRDTRILNHDSTWKQLRSKDYSSRLASQVIAAFDDFLSTSSATILDTNCVRVSEVFDRYFEKSPPFGAGGKEKEFPDAFAIEALLVHAKESGKHVYVVSDDKDFKTACEQHEQLRSIGSFQEAIELSWHHESLVDACHECVHDNLDQVDQIAKKHLIDVRFLLSAPCGRILTTEHLDRELENEAVVELSSQRALLVAVLRIETKFGVEYEAEGDSYYDSDDRLVIPYEAVQEDIHVVLTLPIEVELKITPASEIQFSGVNMNLAEEVEILPIDGYEFAVQEDS
ncbi:MULTISPECIES: PIN domain-containing protein [Pirellulaceae]|uniref:PIN domain-containing protein n=1 Tax=Pirellulaceae TaxID=2691357 RepID=UPI0002BE2138|nr:PIN domain-containing protein [Rhodopirellula sp. SWK7]EMI44911.1 hypothetical protein RRSWK_02551 [Rhodopirellula sp. SWK7]